MLAILDVRQRLVSTNERVDVFGALAWLDVRVIFRPLDGLLGAFIQGDVPGVVISTKRPVSVQRFTGAHEMGHAVLGHAASLDSPDVMRDASYDQPARKISGFASYLQEIEADAFASAFLLPTWLISRHAHRQGWSRGDLTDENVVYQLSLRCGASYQAMVWALDRNRFVSAADRIRLLAVKPKSIKVRLGHENPFADPRGDAWRLSTRDAGIEIPVSIGDTVTVDIQESQPGGTWWTKEVQDAVTPGDPVAGVFPAEAMLELGRPYRIATPGLKRMVFGCVHGGRDPSTSVTLDLVATAPEKGLSRANRRRMISEAQGRGVADAA